MLLEALASHVDFLNYTPNEAMSFISEISKISFLSLSYFVSLIGPYMLIFSYIICNFFCKIVIPNNLGLVSAFLIVMPSTNREWDLKSYNLC